MAVEACLKSLLVIAKPELWVECPHRHLCLCGPDREVDYECVSLSEVRAFCPEVIKNA